MGRVHWSLLRYLNSVGICKMSGLLGDLFTTGAEVGDTSMMGVQVLMLKNTSGGLRMGPTSVVERNEKK